MANDIRWACKKVIGSKYRFNGKVLIQFARDDTVIRWQDVCSENDVQDISCDINDTYRENNFPHASKLSINILEGNHLSPESNADLYVSHAYSFLEKNQH